LLEDYNLNRIKNQELAKLLRIIALYLEMKDVKFKPQAYEKQCNKKYRF